jgi:hypothetical protein
MHKGGYVIRYCLGFEVLTAVIMMSSVFCCVTPCRPLRLILHFGGTCRRRLQGRRKAKQETSMKQVANVGWLSTNYAVLYTEPENWRYYWSPVTAGLSVFKDKRRFRLQIYNVLFNYMYFFNLNYLEI